MKLLYLPLINVKDLDEVEALGFSTQFEETKYFSKQRSKEEFVVNFHSRTLKGLLPHNMSAFEHVNVTADQIKQLILLPPGARQLLLNQWHKEHEGEQ